MRSPLLAPRPAYDLPDLPVVGGPLCGEERPYNVRAWMVEVTEYACHQYILACESNGERYWSWCGTVPLASKVA